MTSVINRLAQFEAGIVAFTNEVNGLENKIPDHEVAIARLNTEQLLMK